MTKKSTIEEMQKIAAERGGKCLSKIYINAFSKIMWQCNHGHQWKAIPASVKNGCWCPACTSTKGKAIGMTEKTIEELHKIAQRRGGKCLSTTFTDRYSKLKWQCSHGHQWEAIPSNIIDGHWCPACGHKTGSVEEMQRIAEARSGKYLSTTYLNAFSKMLWQCKKGHQWEARPGDIKYGGWCPQCAGVGGTRKKGTLEEMQRIAQDRGGKCLSKTYINAHSKIWWECIQGHQWEAKPMTIKRGKWCPTCQSISRWPSNKRR